MNKRDILSNLEITCEQNNVNIIDIMALYIAKRFGMDIYPDQDETILKVRRMLIDSDDILWNMQPSLEENEETAFGVQHARDVLNIFLGDDY